MDLSGRVADDRIRPQQIPLLAGETLRNRIEIAHGKPLPLDEQRMIGLQIAEGLSAAHRAGLIHRDIKPAKIWLEPRRDGVRAKLLDFGLARSNTEVSMTTTDVTIGTPTYMAPEQWMSANVDHRAEVWRWVVATAVCRMKARSFATMLSVPTACN